MPAARAPLLPFAAVIGGIATFSAMDAAMKAAALVIGVYSALLWRNLVATALVLPLWIAAGRPLSSAAALRVHVQRSILTTCMALLFFYGLVRIPLAEGIAISFVAPLAALYFAAAMLGERIRRTAIAASLVGLAGVAVIAAGRMETGAMTGEAAKGTAAVLVSAMFYAVNLVLQRRQALLAGPVEIALFQNLIVALCLLPFAPTFAVVPEGTVIAAVAAGAAFATLALLLLAWGYARAEAQVLVPVEYTGFVWAALFGRLFFGEAVEATTAAGAALIVVACLVATRASVEQTQA